MLLVPGLDHYLKSVSEWRQDIDCFRKWLHCVDRGQRAATQGPDQTLSLPDPEAKGLIDPLLGQAGVQPLPLIRMGINQDTVEQLLPE